MKDHIEREATLNAILDMHCKADGDGYVWILLGDAVRRIDNLPSAEPERKKGKWIWDDEGYHCSECWFHAHGNTLECMDGTYRFCPSCGAEMEAER